MQTIPERLLAVHREFFVIRQTLPLRCVQAFFLVAQEEGLTVSEYARRAGMSRTSMSRNIADLTTRNRAKKDGHALLVKRENDENLCERRVYLTDKGKQLLELVTNVMEGRNEGKTNLAVRLGSHRSRNNPSRSQTPRTRSTSVRPI
jgi:DNA-binding MarR family transcriptional regulator